MVRDYEEAIRRLKEAGVEIQSSVSATSADIAAIEERLGVALPPSYKLMLAQHGNMGFEGLEIFGWTRTGLDADGTPSVLFLTENDRRDGLISNTMVDFMHAGYGPTFVLDCSEADADGEAPVYEIAAGGMRNGRDRLADSFGAFLLKEADRAIADWQQEQAAAADKA